MARNRESAAIAEALLRGHQGRLLSRQTTAPPTPQGRVVEEVGSVRFVAVVPIVAELRLRHVLCQERMERRTVRRLRPERRTLREVGVRRMPVELQEHPRGVPPRILRGARALVAIRGDL